LIDYQIQNNETGTQTIDSMMELIRWGRYKDEPEMLYRAIGNSRQTNFYLIFYFKCFTMNGEAGG